MVFLWFVGNLSESHGHFTIQTTAPRSVLCQVGPRWRSSPRARLPGSVPIVGSASSSTTSRSCWRSRIPSSAWPSRWRSPAWGDPWGSRGIHGDPAVMGWGETMWTGVVLKGVQGIFLEPSFGRVLQNWRYFLKFDHFWGTHLWDGEALSDQRWVYRGSYFDLRPNQTSVYPHQSMVWSQKYIWHQQKTYDYPYPTRIKPFNTIY